MVVLENLRSFYSLIHVLGVVHNNSAQAAQVWFQLVVKENMVWKILWTTCAQRPGQCQLALESTSPSS